jgi:hypothetical protein
MAIPIYHPYKWAILEAYKIAILVERSATPEPYIMAMFLGPGHKS